MKEQNTNISIIKPAQDELGFGTRIYGKDLENCLEYSTYDCPWFLDPFLDEYIEWELDCDCDKCQEIAA